MSLPDSDPLSLASPLHAPAQPVAADVRQRVRALDPWFQNFELAGIATAPDHFLGDYPQLKWRHIRPHIPASLDGLSVLDIGCNAGFYALECKRRGARRVVGIDADARYLAQARLAAEVLGLTIEWHQMSLYDLHRLQPLIEEQQFDYVFFLGVFYHLRYPLYALDLVVKLVRQRLVFQTMLRGDVSMAAPLPDYTFWDHAPFQQAGFPALYFIEHAYAGDPTNWWIPNPAAVEGMLASAGLRTLCRPEPETWICEPAETPRPARGYVWDLELAATL